MIAPRSTLTLRLTPWDAEADIALLLTQAIDNHLCVRWTYNRTLMQAAPQLLYRRHDSLHCDAIIIERGGMKVTDSKLGASRLTGLGGVALTGEPFVLVTIDPGDARYEGGIVARADD